MSPASSSTFVVPMFGIFWGGLILGEPIGIELLAGFGLVIASLVLVLRLPVPRPTEILPRLGGVPPGETTKRPFLDYMSFHALGPDVLGPDTTVDELGDPKFRDRVFDWNQLR